MTYTDIQKKGEIFIKFLIASGKLEHDNPSLPVIQESYIAGYAVCYEDLTGKEIDEIPVKT